LAATITTGVVTGGTNSHATTAAEVNGVATNFVSQGVNGAITNTSGVAPSTGSFAVNAQGTPAMFVDVSAGTAYVTATPSGQASQNLLVSMTSAYTSYAISSNASGSTKYDWIYLKVNPTNANNPASDASDVTALFTSRSSSNSTDNGTPPTYGILLAVVTVANGASSITNGNISDQRTQSYVSSSGDNGVSLQTIRSENSLDYVASGCVWTADSAGSTLNGSMTAGVVYLSGKRVAVSAVTAHGFTASKDTYVDVDNTGTLHYTEVSNNAASPALSSGYLRLAIVVTGGSSIAAAASINQGQESRVLPIASSVPYAVTDSLGNLICPRDPQRKILGYRQITTNFTHTGDTSNTQITGLSVPVIVPANRRVKVTVVTAEFFGSTATDATVISIWDGTVGSGTAIGKAQNDSNQAGAPGYCEAVVTPSASSKTYNAALATSNGTHTATFSAASTYPAFIKVELV